MENTDELLISEMPVDCIIKTEQICSEIDPKLNLTKNEFESKIDMYNEKVREFIKLYI